MPCVDRLGTPSVVAMPSVLVTAGMRRLTQGCVEEEESRRAEVDVEEDNRVVSLVFSDSDFFGLQLPTDVSAEEEEDKL